MSRLALSVVVVLWGVGQVLLAGEAIANEPATLSVNDVVAVEGNRELFEVTLSEPSDDLITVRYVTIDGSAKAADKAYESHDGIVTFRPGQIKRKVVVQTRDDNVRGDKTTFFRVRLLNPTNARVADGDGTAVIWDNDHQPSILVHNRTANESREMKFVVSLTNPYREAVKVDYRTVAGTAEAETDFEPVTGTLEIAPGEMESVISVPTLRRDVIPGALFTGNRTLSVVLAKPRNADIRKGEATGTIIATRRAHDAPAEGGGSRLQQEPRLRLSCRSVWCSRRSLRCDSRRLPYVKLLGGLPCK